MRFRKYGDRSLPVRRLAAWGACCAGFGLLIYLIMAPGWSGIPGWQPVNESLRATMAAGQGAAIPVHKQPPANDEIAQPGSPPAADSPTPKLVSSDATALLDLNEATVAQLEGLPGIGPSKAQAIVSYRESHQRFRTVKELLDVKGIGPKLYERIHSLVRVGGSS